MLVIPHAPEALRLPIERHWDGTRCPDPRRRGELSLALAPDALEIGASFERLLPARVPDAPSGTRVANLWEYDVVECFLAGARGRYLEIELGAAGHFLVLEFDAPRRRSNEHADLRPAVSFRQDEGRWHAALRLPLDAHLYLGLIHHADEAGDRRRIATARTVTPRFGVATECGWGRTDPARVTCLLASHRHAAALLAQD